MSFDVIKTFDSICTRHVDHNVTMLLELLKNKNDVVLIDVGANTGAFTDKIMSACSVRTAILFEPQTDLYSYLISKYQSYNNVIVENLALSDGIFDFKLNDDAFHEHVTRNSVEDINLGLSKIYYTSDSNGKKTEYLDNIFNKYHIEKIDILKVDTEGEDLRVLSGFSKTLSSLHIKPIIIFESNWKNNQTREHAEELLSNFCITAGYINNINLDDLGDFFLLPINY